MKFRVLTLFVCFVVLCSCLVVPSFADNSGASADGFDASDWAYKYTITYDRTISFDDPFDVPNLDNTYLGPFYVVTNINGVIAQGGGLYVHSMYFRGSFDTRTISIDLWASEAQDDADMFYLNCTLEPPDMDDGGYMVNYSYYPSSNSNQSAVTEMFNSLDLVSFEIYSQDEIDLSAFSSAWVVDVSVPSDGGTSLPFASISAAWTGVLSWLVASLVSGQFIFYNDGFTFLGVLLLIGMAVALAFLLIAIARKFLKLGG